MNDKKRDNPYLTDSTPLTKRPQIALKDETHTLSTHGRNFNDTTPLLGGNTGIYFRHLSNRHTTSDITHEQRLYGNYTNYYESRRNAASHHDARLALLDVSLFKGKTVLDIGCNSGNVTLAIGQNCKPNEILGVDIDDRLIKKANSQKRILYSLQKPSYQENDIPKDSTTATDLSKVDIRLQSHYFPQSMSAMYGHLPINVPPSFGTGIFPFNTSFEAGDWMDMDIKENYYDTILALSITKWIHLHRGDQGIKTFFQAVYQSLKKGGVFVLEPQLFATYERRTKASKEMNQMYESIQFKPEDFHDYLMYEVGFNDHQQLTTPDTDSKGFSRPIHQYIK